MKRIFPLIAVALFAGPLLADDRPVRAEDEPDFYLGADGKVEKRFVKIESEIDLLKKQVKALQDANYLRNNPRPSPTPKAGFPVSPFPTDDKPEPKKAESTGYILYDVCNGKQCVTYRVPEGSQIPLNASNVRLVSASPKSALAAEEDFVQVESVVNTAASSGSARGGRIWFPGKRLFQAIRGNRANRSSGSSAGGCSAGCTGN